MTQHRPWVVYTPADEKYYLEIWAMEKTVAKVTDADDAAHIVHCVNTYDALVEGLAYLVHVIGEVNVPGNIMATLEQARKEQQP